MQPLMQGFHSPVRPQGPEPFVEIEKISNGVIVRYEVPRAVTMSKPCQPPGTYPIPTSINPVVLGLLKKQLEKLEEGEGWKGEETVAETFAKLEVEMKELFQKPRILALTYYVSESLAVYCATREAVSAEIGKAQEAATLIEQYKAEGKWLWGQPMQEAMLSGAVFAQAR